MQIVRIYDREEDLLRTLQEVDERLVQADRITWKLLLGECNWFMRN